MASEGPKNLPTRSAEEAKAATAAQESAQAPPKSAKAASKKAPAPADELPDFIIERNKLFEELWQEYLQELKNKSHPEINITIDLGDGKTSTVTAKAFETTPAQLLKDVPKELSANVVISKVNGQLYDLNRPFEQDAKVSYVPFDSAEGKEVFWHSSAHCLGEACECEYGCLLSHGPPTPQGFFYDMAIPEGYVICPIFVLCTQPETDQAGLF
jgi:threonyl-tRNA synthetase